MFLKCNYKDIGVHLFFLLIVWKLYGNVTYLWWTYDDTQLLKHSILYNPFQYFFEPHIWQRLSSSFLSPLLVLSFDINKALFGLNPEWFYIHHLVIIWLCGMMFFIVLRRWVERFFAFTGTLLFFISSPLAVLSQQLMTRHYLEGLLFALISIHLFVKGLDKEDKKQSYFSAFMYLIAMTAKEVYVPLIFALLVLPLSNWKNRFKYLLPHAVVLFLYSIWRWYMLGTPVGGYGYEMEIQNILLLPYTIINFLFDLKSISGIVASAVLIVFLIVFWFKQRRAALFGIWIGLLAMLPIMTVAHTPAHRYFLVIWVVITVFFVFIFRFTWHSKPVFKMLCVCMILSIVFQTISQSLRNWNENLLTANQMSAEGKFIFGEANSISDILRKPAFEGHYLDGVNWLKYNYYHDKRVSGWFYDDIYLCENNLEGKRVFEYSLKEQKIMDITTSIPLIVNNYCTKIKNDAPLFIKGKYSKNIVSWELGPYDSGKYSFILGGMHTKRDIPQKGSLRVNFKDYIVFRVRYESPDGWITFSPYLILEINDRNTIVHWERGKTQQYQ